MKKELFFYCASPALHIQLPYFHAIISTVVIVLGNTCDFFVFVQIRFESECFSTSLTGKRLGVGVGLNVSAEVGLVCESLGTNATRERPFAWKRRK